MKRLRIELNPSSEVVLSVGYTIPDDVLEDMIAVAQGTNGEVSQHDLQSVVKPF